MFTPIKPPIIIVGAGPIGLCLAIKLKQKGVKDITVIDPRANQYTRVAKLSPVTVAKVYKSIGLMEPAKQPIGKIKNVERDLYKIALDNGVNIQNQTFKRFTNQGLETTDNVQMKCGVAFDCTGAKRTLIKEVNNNLNQPHFKVKALADNPLKKHFFAYVEILPHHIQMLQNPKEDLLNQVMGLEKLRSEFGWDSLKEPNLIGPVANNKNNKVRLYFEVPDNLPEDQYDAWLKALLQLKSGESIDFKHVTSKKAHVKPQSLFNAFLVDPQEVTPTFYKGDTQHPIVIGAGDAIMEADYRSGQGVLNGIDEINAIVDAIEVNEAGEIANINYEHIDSKIHEIKEEYQHRLEKRYQDIVQTINQAAEEGPTKYLQATLLTNDPLQQKRLEKAIEKIKTTEAMKLFNGAVDIYNKIFNDELIFNQQNFDPILLEQAKAKLFKALATLPASMDKEHKKIMETMYRIAKNYNALATYQLSTQEHTGAMQNFQHALDFLNQSNNPLYIEEKNNILINLINIQNENKSYGNVILLADEALNFLSQTPLVDPQKKIAHDNFNYHKIFAALNKVDIELDAGYSADAGYYYEEATKIVPILEENGVIEKNKLNQLKEKMETIQGKIDQLPQESDDFDAAP